MGRKEKEINRNDQNFFQIFILYLFILIDRTWNNDLERII